MNADNDFTAALKYETSRRKLNELVARGIITAEWLSRADITCTEMPCNCGVSPLYRQHKPPICPACQAVGQEMHVTRQEVHCSCGRTFMKPIDIPGCCPGCGRIA